MTESTTVRSAEVGVVDRDRGNFIYTYSGVRFFPTDPLAEEMVIDDIVHSLALQCRFTGHVRKFYSVGEHCVRMVKEAIRRNYSEKIQYQALMHDCSETWLVDIPRPLKAEPQFGARYKTMESRIMDIAAEKFGFDWPMFPEIVELDAVLLNTEQRDLMPVAANEGGSWFPEYGVLPGKQLQPWTPELTKQRFAYFFHLLAPTKALR